MSDALRPSGGTLTRAQRLERSQAFTYADHLLYFYALIAYFISIFLLPDTWMLPPHIGVPCMLLIFLVYAFVLSRNYLVMRAIDEYRSRADRQFLFLRLNFGVAQMLEKIARLAIILMVILTPKSSYLKWVVVPVQYLSETIRDRLRALLEPVGSVFLDVKYRDNATLHEVVPYYGTVLLLLFLLFLLWDVINVVAAMQHIRTERMKRLVSEDGHEIQGTAYRSLLIYFNICLRSSDPKRPALAEFRMGKFLYKPHLRKLVRDGSIGRLYLRSPKFWERFFGILMSLAIILAGDSELAPIPLAALAIVIVLYGIMVAANPGCLKDFGKFWGLLRSYFMDIRWRPKAADGAGAVEENHIALR